MKLSVSTGSFYKTGRWIGTNRAIQAISKLGIKNIELCLITFDKLEGFDLAQAKKDLKKFKIIGLHLPSTYYLKDAETKRVVDYYYYLYCFFEASYAVVHHNWLKDPYYLKKKKWLVLVENNTRRHRTGYRKFGRLIKKHRLDIILDVNHASDYGLKEVSHYVEYFRNKIRAVHLAGGHKRKSFWHQSFSKAPKKLIKSFEPIKKLDTLVIIEDNGLNVQKLKKEIKIIKQWLKN